MDQKDYLALRKALNLLHQYIEEDRFDLQIILVDAEDVLRDYENTEESNDSDGERMISTVKWINAQIEIDNLKNAKKQTEENEE
jgi:hypothetical protein